MKISFYEAVYTKATLLRPRKIFSLLVSLSRGDRLCVSSMLLAGVRHIQTLGYMYHLVLGHPMFDRLTEGRRTPAMAFSTDMLFRAWHMKVSGSTALYLTAC